MKFNFTQFSGMAPRISPRLLPGSLSQQAIDVKMWSGELRPHYGDTLIKRIPADTKTVYKYKHLNVYDVWFSWPTMVNVVKGPVYADEANKIYLTGVDSQMRVTSSSIIDRADTTIDSTNSYIVGIPAPTDIEMAVSGTGSGTTEARSYTVCFVRKWADGQLDIGKSSLPAQTAAGNLTVDVQAGQSVTISNIVPPANYADIHITQAYIYRTEISSKGGAIYSYLDSVPITSTTAVSYVDTKTAADLAEALPSMYYDPPIENIEGLISLNNGIFAAFKGTDVYLSAPYQPHAWPAEYRITVDYPVVGLGAFGSTLVICTEASPVLAVVQDPATPTIRPVQEAIPCISARSIVNTRTGVIYASTSGLVLVNSSAPTHITEKLISKDEWSKMNPASLYGEFLENTYYGFFTEPNEVMGFVFDLDNYAFSSTYNTLLQSGLIYTSIPTRCSWSDISDSAVYRAYKPDYATDLNLVSMHTAEHTNKTFRWRSKVMTSPSGLFTLAAGRVMFDQFANSANRTYPIVIKPVSLYAAINKYPLNTEPIDGWMYITIVGDGDQPNTVIFNYYVDGKLRYTKRVLTNQPFRLPSGFRGDYAEVEIKSNAWIHSVIVASSMAECTQADDKK